MAVSFRLKGVSIPLNLLLRGGVGQGSHQRGQLRTPPASCLCQLGMPKVALQVPVLPQETQSPRGTGQGPNQQPSNQTVAERVWD